MQEVLEPSRADVPANIPLNVLVYERQKWFLEQLFLSPPHMV